jgi:hypothetical protein
MATTADSIRSEGAHVIEKGYPVGGIRFDWMFTALASWLVGGLYLDGWAHNHGKVDDSFFTPWHGVFYSGFMVVALFLFINQWRNMGKGYPLRRALPVGYWLSLVGAGIFAVGGVGDLIWHTLFGIEDDLAEALMSPSHLSLALGIVLIASGPLRAAWRRSERAGDWKTLGPTLLSVTMLLSVFIFFTGFASPLFDVLAVRRFADSYQAQNIGVSSVLIQSAVMMTLLLPLVRRWSLPFGALMLVITLSNLMVVIVTDEHVFALSALAAGLIADVLLHVIKPSAEKAERFYLFAFAVPAAYFAMYFLAVQLTRGIGWSIHLWLGSIFVAGVIGLFVSFLMLWPLGYGDDTSHSVNG